MSRAGKGNAIIAVIHNKVSALKLNGNIFTLFTVTAQHGGHHRGAGPGPAGHRLAVAALPHTHFKGVLIYDAHKFRVYAFWEDIRKFELRTDALNIHIIYPAAENNAVRVADAHAGDIIFLAADIDRAPYNIVSWQVWSCLN